MRRLCRIAIVCVALVGLAVSLVKADTLTYNYSITLQSVGWTEDMIIPKFDPTLGTLNSITFTLQGTVTGDAKFESRDKDPSTVTMDLAAKIELQRPNNSTLVQIIPLAATSDNVTAYDGTTDFGGTSGKTYTGLSATQTDSSVSPPPAGDLTLFTGPGNITLKVKARSASDASGPGNLVTQFSTNAGALATVVYDYTPVPEPTGMIAMLAGFGGLVGFIRRRRR
jgi:hypothetical protein